MTTNFSVWIRSIVEFELGATEPNKKKCSNENCQLSIYIPAFNSEETIEITLKSLLDQVTSYEFCITVLNDSSNDSTAKKIEKLQKSYTNLRKFENPFNLGIIPSTKIARELALQTCHKSKYIALGSDHDYWEDSFIQESVHVLDTQTHVSLLVFDEQTRRHVKPNEEGDRQNARKTLDLTKIRKRARAGRWIYGVERKNFRLAKVFYSPVVGPDQLYTYSHLLFGHVLEIRKKMITFREKEFPTSSSRDALIRMPFRKLYLIEASNKINRLVSHLRVLKEFKSTSTYERILYTLYFTRINVNVKSNPLKKFIIKVLKVSIKNLR